jgi:NAD(P)-dependent dehydrogenase (short-subunit alcohol dehydrogenase family)
MTRAMARELGDWNICVNTVTPGFVMTAGRQVDPEYEKIRTQQRSIKRSQVEGIWSVPCCFYLLRRAFHDRPVTQRGRRISLCRIR